MRRKFAVTLLALSALCTGLTLAACGEKGPTGDGGEPGGDAQGHVHELTYVAAVEATCTEAGSLEYWTCSDCSKNFADEAATEELSSIEVPAGHTEVVDKAVEATCTEDGLTEGKHCSVCNEVLVEQEVVEATGHHYENGVCADCGEKEPFTEGLIYTLSLDGTSYSVTRYEGADVDVYILSTHNGLPVTSIGYSAFV